MKISSLLFLILIAFIAPSFGQYPTKTIDKTYALPAGKQVDMNLKFARDIVVRSWQRNELGLKITLMMSEEKLEEVHVLKVVEGADRLSINTDYDFDDYKDQWDKQCWNCNREDRDEDCICLSVSYELMLPADADLRLETISGDIDIQGLSGPLKIKSISGFVDLSLSPGTASALRFKSVTGEIFTDFDLKLDKGSTPYSKKLNTEINGGGELISLETVSGNIYFRKKG